MDESSALRFAELLDAIQSSSQPAPDGDVELAADLALAARLLAARVRTEPPILRPWGQTAGADVAPGVSRRPTFVAVVLSRWRRAAASSRSDAGAIEPLGDRRDNRLGFALAVGIAAVAIAGVVVVLAPAGRSLFSPLLLSAPSATHRAPVPDTVTPEAPGGPTSPAGFLEVGPVRMPTKTPPSAHTSGPARRGDGAAGRSPTMTLPRLALATPPRSTTLAGPPVRADTAEPPSTITPAVTPATAAPARSPTPGASPSRTRRPSATPGPPTRTPGPTVTVPPFTPPWMVTPTPYMSPTSPPTATYPPATAVTATAVATATDRALPPTRAVTATSPALSPHASRPGSSTRLARSPAPPAP
jgi:hypothetical protein